MPRMHNQPGEKLPLELSADERRLILQDSIVAGMEYEAILRETPTGKPLLMTLDDLDDFAGYIAAEANHCRNKKNQKTFDAVLDKVQHLLDRFTDLPPSKVKSRDAEQEKLASDQAAQMAEWAARALEAAKRLRIKTKPLERLRLAPAQRDLLLAIPGLSRATRNKLAKNASPLTVAEAAAATMAIAEALVDAKPRDQVAMLFLSKTLMHSLQERITEAAKPKARARTKRASETESLFQFKITLLGVKPLIWRRIQVEECTLDILHEHIQTAMGWTNSHLHQFEIGDERYGDPELLDDGFGDFNCIDSRTTMVNQILPPGGKRFAFRYEYDFGDGWEHEILFEGCPPPEKGKNYPRCVEGDRACPPEDVGGLWGYEDFLAAIADREHENHASFLKWCGGSFSPDKFDPKKATRKMKKGLPDWRNMWPLGGIKDEMEPSCRTKSRRCH